MMIKLNKSALAGLLVAPVVLSAPINVSAMEMVDSLEIAPAAIGISISGGCFSDSQMASGWLADTVHAELYSKSINENAPYCYYQSLTEALAALNGEGVEGTVTLVLADTDSKMRVEYKAGYQDISVVAYYSESQAGSLGLPGYSPYFNGPNDGKQFVGWKDESGNIHHARTKVPAYVADGYTLTAVWVDKTELEETVGSTAELTEEDYTADSWSELQEALQAAQSILNNVDAEQDAVDSANNALKDAVEKLISIVELRDAITEAAGIQSGEYTPETAEPFEAALATAQDTLANPAATDEEIATAIENLQAAQENLAKKADKTELQAAIDSAAELNKADYTADSWSALQEALEAAQDILDDDNISEANQADVDAATAALLEAIENLEKAETPIEIPAAPKTNDNIMTWVAMMAISVTMLAAISFSAVLAMKKATDEE